MKVQIFQFEIKEADFENNKNKIAQFFEDNYLMQMSLSFPKCGTMDTH